MRLVDGLFDLQAPNVTTVEALDIEPRVKALIR